MEEGGSGIRHQAPFLLSRFKLCFLSTLRCTQHSAIQGKTGNRMAQTEKAADKTLAVKGVADPARGRTPFHRWEKMPLCECWGLTFPLPQIMKVLSWKLSCTVCFMLQIIIAYPGVLRLGLPPRDDHHQNWIWVAESALLKIFFLWF